MDALGLRNDTIFLLYLVLFVDGRNHQSVGVTTMNLWLNDDDVDDQIIAGISSINYHPSDE